MTSHWAELNLNSRQQPPPLDEPNSSTYDNLPTQLRPGPTACANCPSAVWYSHPDNTHCQCLLLSAECYTSDHPSARIQTCDGALISTLQLLRRDT